MTKHRHIGSSFDDFLMEEGILEECKEEAAKRILIWHLEREMQNKENLLDCNVDLVTKNALHPALKSQILHEAKYVF